MFLNDIECEGKKNVVYENVDKLEFGTGDFS